MRGGDLPYRKLFSPDEFGINETLLLDLVDVFAAIYTHDIVTKRVKKTKIKVCVPVNNYGLWCKCKELLTELVDFVTSYVDDWDIEFHQLNTPKITEHGRLFYLKDFFSPEKNILFSGGLDSFSGITRDLAGEESNIMLTGFRINNVEFGKQKHLFGNVFKLKDQSSICKIFELNDLKKEEYTQRTRSLLFFALGVNSSNYFKLPFLYLYENGIMSLNPEVNQSRYTTKTTHPITISKFNRLLEQLGINVRIKHPFIYKTKGEMVSNIPIEFHSYIRDTITCGRSRQDPRYDASKYQCGSCVPCVLRKISLSYAGLEEYDSEYDVSYNHKINQPHALLNEYKSSIKYYVDFKKYIDDYTIFDILNLKSTYYSDLEYISNTSDLLSKFSSEVDLFLKKHQIL